MDIVFRNPSGRAVDWYIVYRLPKNATIQGYNPKNLGTASWYLYFSNEFVRNAAGRADFPAEDVFPTMEDYETWMDTLNGDWMLGNFTQETNPVEHTFSPLREREALANRQPGPLQYYPYNDQPDKVNVFCITVGNKTET